ncbi:nicotinate phosphoribosyltransferase [Candidatus Coxiella mudrowiae]|uniref:Nicotinate phosphoribosyltransferase n=1 Tax=Candidatus Coxiella mudrowiae TaxID=2054173 RepID=A0ABN4HSJ1_9COXI|nr:nicotinate phosphoribosyltransferase [Candidatus Coxiella mudrowiae]AKQ33670.1 Nicotinate phosphoribosyltransferase [Candidatus Coxiella mudrowiae]
MIHFTATYTDFYQLTIGQVYFLEGKKNQVAVFDYFFRKLPFKGGYAIFSGLEDLLTILQQFKFSKRDIDFLFHQGFHSEFLHYLKNFRFNGNVYASQEGDLIFPTRPVLTIEAPLIEAQIIETLILNILNFQTLIATKASRIRYVAGDKRLIDFGLRRTAGLAGYYASRAAIVGGFDATSNVIAGRDYAIPVAGTMSHSFVQSYDNELSAFRDFAESRPQDCVLLVDTYDTLKSGVPNAIQVGKEMESRGQQLKGVRLDSGGLSYLAKKTRKMLDEAGLSYVKIVASNQLDEYVIKSLLEQKSPIDIFGVGTKLVIGEPDGVLDGVYKLAFSHNKPRFKLSETPTKITLPYKKQVYRLLDNQGSFLGADVVTLVDEKDTDIMYHPFESLKFFHIKNYKKEALLHKIMENGKRLSPAKTLNEIAKYSQHRLSLLPEKYKRFNNPHIYKVGLSSELNERRNHLIEAYKKNENSNHRRRSK